MSHHHYEHHKHEHESESPMSLPEKLDKLLQHWIRHNEDHAATYTKWADEARAHGMLEIAEVLDRAAQKNLEINIMFRNAEEYINKP